MNSVTCIVAAAEPRLFGLDAQLLFDAGVLAINIFILFFAFSYLMLDPIKNMLAKRQERISTDIETAENNKKDAIALKEEYDAKLKEVDKEVELILSDARKKAVHNQNKLVEQAKEEAARIIENAKREANLEKQKVADEMKQEMIQLATLMANKMVAVSIDEATQNKLVEETLGEIGDNTWQS